MASGVGSTVRGMTTGWVRKLSFALTLGTALSLGMTACGADKVPQTKDGATAATPPAEEEGPTTEDAEEFLNDVFSGDIERQEKAIAQTKPGSLAHAYAYHQQQTTQARIDSGEDPRAANHTFKTVDAGIEHCAGTAPDRECAVFGGFKADGEKFVDFTVNGESLSDRISLGNGKRIPAGKLGSVEFLTAYKTQEGTLVVTFIARSREQKITLGLGSATYRDPEGRTAQTIGSSTVAELGPDSLTNGLLAFKNAKPGGAFSFEFYDEDYEGVEVRVPTR